MEKTTALQIIDAIRARNMGAMYAYHWDYDKCLHVCIGKIPYSSEAKTREMTRIIERKMDMIDMIRKAGFHYDHADDVKRQGATACYFYLNVY